MTEQNVAVLSRRPELLATLRERCPDYHFLEGPGRDDLDSVAAVVDDDSLDQVTKVPASPVARILLGAPPASSNDDSVGEIHIARAAFLADPVAILNAASQMTIVRRDGEIAQGEMHMAAHLQQLIAITDTRVLSERVSKSMLEILKLPFATMLLHDPRFERFMTTFSDDPDHLETGEYLPGVPHDLLQDALASETGYAFERPRHGIDGALLFPIQLEQDLLGVIKVNVPSHSGFVESRAEQAMAYLRIVQTVILNLYQLIRSRELAMRDDLTRSFNRRFFEAYFLEEMERARRYKSVLSIIFLDLDDLKLVNNAYGHMAGSKVLQEVARRIMAAVRGIDKVVRFGGDEFCVILPQTDHEQATAVALRIRESIIKRPIELDGDMDASITASFGIAAYPLHATNTDDLISAADAAMLLVKSTTKNEIGIARAPGKRM